MSKETFTASTQYNDFKGTSAADRADNGGANDWLEARGLKQKDEFLLGIEFFAGENHGEHKDPIYVDFLLASVGNYETVKSMVENSYPVPLRKVSVSIPTSEFFGLFKRFSICISVDGMIDGREYTY